MTPYTVQFDDDMVRVLKVRAKRQLRSRMRGLRQALPGAAVARRSARIVEKITTLREYEAARRIALFWPMDGAGEVDLRALDARARASGKVVYYPFIDVEAETPRVGFRLVEESGELAERGRGFCEPDPGAPEAAADGLDLVVVPALAVTEDGHRLGFGSGFYDQVLRMYCPPARSVVVAFDFQLLAELPTAEHDVACDVVVIDR